MCDIYIMLMFIIWFWILQEPCEIGKVDAIYTPVSQMWKQR